MIKNIYIIDDKVSSKVNGIGTYIKELVYALKVLKMNICLIYLNHETENFQIVIEEGIKKIHFSSKFHFGLYYNYKAVSYVLKLHIDDSPENLFIVNHNPCENFLKYVKILFPVSKLVFVIHDMGWTYRLLGDTDKLKEIINSQYDKEIVSKYENLIKYFKEEQRMYDIVDKVIVLAKDTELLLKEVYNLNHRKIFFAPNGLRDYLPVLDALNPIEVRNKLNVNINDRIILYVGRVNKIKGIYHIINSFKKIYEKNKNCRLVIIGTLFEPLETLKEASEIATRITFTGQITSNEVINWYRVSDIGILPSYYEQCSYAGIEMMMYGLPIVSSDGFCLKNMFNEENSLIASIDRIEKSDKFTCALSNAIQKILKSNQLSEKLSRASRLTYETNYTISHMISKYKKLLLSL